MHIGRTYPRALMSSNVRWCTCSRRVNRCRSISQRANDPIAQSTAATTTTAITTTTTTTTTYVALRILGGLRERHLRVLGELADVARLLLVVGGHDSHDVGVEVEAALAVLGHHQQRHRAVLLSELRHADKVLDERAGEQRTQRTERRAGRRRQRRIGARRRAAAAASGATAAAAAAAATTAAAAVTKALGADRRRELDAREAHRRAAIGSSTWLSLVRLLLGFRRRRRRRHGLLHLELTSQPTNSHNKSRW